MAGREERISRNEALFREVNERIREITTYDEGVEFLCECSDPSCAEPVLMTLAEYEAVRAYPTHFFVVPGHEVPDVETVVGGGDAYAVVEKHPGVPAEVAAETDPRS